MRKYFVDLHVHIGRTGKGAPVKITAAASLTVPNILEECYRRKGIDMVGIVDASAPGVQEDLYRLVNRGDLAELEGGGLRYKEQLTLILGAELETTEFIPETEAEGLRRTGNAHCLCYFPRLENMSAFTRKISEPGKVKNPTLSSQRANLTMQELWEITNALDGFIIPAHCFTPHKGVYGNCVSRIRDILSPEAWADLAAIELGLSSDSDYADMISELKEKTFVTNSDAHSLPKIGREYNVMQMAGCDFEELKKALQRKEGRAVIGNYGFDPKLGKYHRTFCENCGDTTEAEPPVYHCHKCGQKADGRNVVMGVLDRIYQIRDQQVSIKPVHRPDYIHQIPLQNIPGIGAKTMDKIFVRFREMDILHSVERDELIDTVGQKAAELILAAREGRLEIASGGGGHYGKVTGRKES